MWVSRMEMVGETAVDGEGGGERDRAVDGVERGEMAMERGVER